MGVCIAEFVSCTKRAFLRDQDISAQDCQDMAASLTVKDIAVVTPVSFVHYYLSLSPMLQSNRLFSDLCNVKPRDLSIPPPSPRVFTLSSSQTGPPDTPFRSSPPTRYPYPLSTRKTPIGSNPSTSSTSNHSFNPPSYQEPPNPPNPFRLFTPIYKLVHVTDERALDLFR